MSNTVRNIFVVPGSHFDLGWCASPAETFAYGDLIIKDAIDSITGEFPEFKFTVEYALFLKHFLDTFPHYNPKVRHLIHDGKLEVSALWTGMMDQIMDGEAAIRNVVLAKRWAKKELGIDLVTAQSSDCPGHTIQLPQILARCGVRYLAYSRYSAPIPLHRWLAPDGSAITAANHSVGLYRSLPDASWAGSGYGWGLIFMRSLEDVEAMLPGHLKDIESLWDKDQPVLMGAESDMLPAYTDMVPKVKKWNERHQDIRLQFSTITQFFNSVKEGLPEYCGEAPYEFHTLGACIPETYIKSKYAHSMLTSAEKLSSIQEILGLGISNKALLDEAWEGLSIPHDHNVGGRHGEINDVVRQHCVERAIVNANNASEESMLFIMTQIDYPKDSGIPIIVFNPLSWERSEPIETYIETSERNFENIAIFDHSGRQMPAQFLRSEDHHGYRRIHFIFIAEDMPSIGYKTFYARFPENDKKQDNILNVSKDIIENQHLRISLDRGIIKSIFWKHGDTELSRNDDFASLMVRENTECDVLDHLTGRTWKESDIRSVEVVESGPVRAKLRIQSEIIGCSLTKELSLYSDLPYAEFSVSVDWAGERNRELLLSFPFNIPDGYITYETPYGHVDMRKDEMPGTYRGEGGRHVQKWIDVSNDNMGVCVGTDCVSNILNGTDINPMMIRTAYSCGTPHHWYDNIGTHKFRFTIFPHSGGWKRGYRIGWQHTALMQVGRMNICAPIAPIKGKVFLPQVYSMCDLSTKNVVLTTVKRSDDHDDSYILRLVEICGNDADIDIKFAFSLNGAWKTDLLEQDIEALLHEEHSLKCHISPYEICTIKIMPKKG